MVRATPLLIQEGWTRHQEEAAKPPLTERTGWSRMEPFLRNAFRNASAIRTTPSAPLRCLRIFLLMAQPPLLYQEGNSQPSIHSRIRRSCLQVSSCRLGSHICSLQQLEDSCDRDTYPI